MKSFEFEAIGTHWFIEVYDDIVANDFEIILEKIVEHCKVFENNYSRFKDTSLVSKLNKDKVLNNPSAEFIEILELGKNAKEITDGHFDIAVGKVLENKGYDAVYSFKSKESKIEKEIIFSKDKIELSENTRIDFGGIGKGYLIDRVSELIMKEGIKYFFINAGGDIYATSNEDEPLEFALENPFALDEMIGTIEIKNKALASSAGNRRKWKDQKGKEHHHLIDMKDNKNINTVKGIFIEGTTTTNADIASTCLFVSPKEMYDKIAKFYGIDYLVVYSDKSFLKTDNYNGKLLNT
ncbi:MAG: FAD:protein FMN transferase [Candidatus Dojkabacteria bacterium]